MATKETAVEQAPKKYKFQVLAGGHLEPQADGSERQFNAGEIVETDTDLAERFNSRGSQKFAAVSGITAQEIKARGLDKSVSAQSVAGVVDDGFDAMTIEELRAWAAEEEIDLGEFKKKSAIIRCIRAAVAISPAVAS